MTSDQPTASKKNAQTKSLQDGETTSGHLGRTTGGEETADPSDIDACELLTETIGKYELRRLLGEGGMGAVYLGYDPLIQREVAIKVLRAGLAKNSNSLSRFLAEARAVGQLSHPNAIAIYDIGEEDDEYFIVMELAKGGSCNEMLAKKTRLPFVEASRMTHGSRPWLGGGSQGGSDSSRRQT